MLSVKYLSMGELITTKTDAELFNEAFAQTIVGNQQVYAKTDTASIRARQLWAAAFKSQTHNNQSYKLKPNKENSGFDMIPNSGSGKDNTHLFNIVDGYTWTYSKFREEVPRIKLVEKQIKSNQHLNFLLNNINNFGTSNVDPYQGLYAIAENTGFEYILPYISNVAFTAKSSWSKTIPKYADMYGKGADLVVNSLYSSLKKTIINATGGENESPLKGVLPSKISTNDIGEAALMGSAVTTNDPFVGIESPSYFQGPSLNAYTIVFPLFNTKSVEDAQKNYDFVRLLTYQNLFNRKTLTTYDPPVMYECFDVEGHIGALGHKPAMYISKLDIKNIGNARALSLGGGSKVVIPEAYMVSITLSELIATSRQIFSSIFTGDSIVSVSGLSNEQLAAKQAEFQKIREEFPLSNTPPAGTTSDILGFGG